jgi:hypothetical protein
MAAESYGIPAKIPERYWMVSVLVTLLPDMISEEITGEAVLESGCPATDNRIEKKQIRRIIGYFRLNRKRLPVEVG